jgi:DNA-directed RNA polymerase subunit RPC12/RpoP
LNRKHKSDWVCLDCGELFTVYGKRNDRTIHCNYCGDHVAVQRYSARKHANLVGTSIPWKRSEIEKLKELMQVPGNTWEKIAKELNRRRASVSLFARDNNLLHLKVRVWSSQHGRPKLTDEEVRAIYADQRDAKQIAGEYRISEKTVNNIRKKRDRFAKLLEGFE